MGKGMKAGKKKSGGGNFGGMGGGKSRSGGGGGQAAQMAQLQAMQAQMAKIQEELDEKEVTTTAGGGAVSVTANGKKEIVSITIDPDVMDKDDPEMLQDLVLVAVNEALRQIEELSQAGMSALTGGLGLPEGLL
jgi:DNA-binding YbaB/EbfC family protein